jgi:hypothetical protein
MVTMTPTKRAAPTDRIWVTGLNGRDHPGLPDLAGQVWGVAESGLVCTAELQDAVELVEPIAQGGLAVPMLDMGDCAVVGETTDLRHG